MLLIVEYHQENMQFIKFCLVGITNTLLAYVINIIALLFMESHDVPFDYVIANLIAFFLSVLWSFYLNSKFTFQMQFEAQRAFWGALVRTYISYSVTGILLFNLLSFFLIDICNFSKFYVPLINLTITVPLNFVLNKFWAFNNPH